MVIHVKINRGEIRSKAYADHYYRMALENRTSPAPRPEKQEEVRENKPVPIEKSSEVAAVFGWVSSTLTRSGIPDESLTF